MIRLLCRTVLLLCLAACTVANDRQTYRFSGDIFGTQYQIILAGAEATVVDVIQQAVVVRLQDIDQTMSHYRQDSELTRLNQAPAGQKILISPSMYEVLALSQHMYNRTDGFFDITLLPLIEFWGFGTQHPPKHLPDQQVMHAWQQQIGSDQFVLSREDGTPYMLKKRPLILDLSAIAKGYAVDQLAVLLEQDYGVDNYLIDIGGELRTAGHKAGNRPWRVAIEAPFFNRKALYKSLAVYDIAMASSGDYRNFYLLDGQLFSHTIDPVTGWPVRDACASVSVIADTAAEADAYATALMAMGSARAWAFAQARQLKVYMINRDPQNHHMQARQTEAFQRFVDAVQP